MRKEGFYRNSCLSLLVLICFPLFLSGQKSTIIAQSKPTPKEGRDLAQIYCAQCHLFPEPASLDRKTWSLSVLPNMGARLGIKSKGKNPYAGMGPEDLKFAKKKNLYPNSPQITASDWKKIEKYYLKNAPKKMPLQESYSNVGELFPFEAKFINVGNSKLPQVTLLRFDPEKKELYVGDYTDLYAINTNGKMIGSWELSSPASHMEFKEAAQQPYVLNIGSLLPSDGKSGSFFNLKDEKNKKDLGAGIFNLRRPVNFAIGDLDMNDKEDVVICNYGHLEGELSWFADMDGSKETVLSNLPGARKVELKDMNGDNNPDVVALMCQAFEQVVIFYNRGGGKFDQKTVLRFPPVHGANYFELADFNDDGHEDLLVTNGDNRDFSPIDKPYHGVRIYINDGHDNFEETFFFPLYDCSKAMAADFDKDGDLDIFAASLYTSYSSIKGLDKSIAYLSNQGDLNFSASYLPEILHGKWLTMEVGDFSDDGYPDVMLGTYIYDFTEMIRVTTKTGMATIPHVLLLTKIR